VVELVRSGLNLPVFALVLCRSAGIILAAPIFSNVSIPARVKAALTVLFGLVMFPVAAQYRQALPGTALGYLPLALTEMGLGLIMGLAGAMVIGALHAAGGLMAQQIGLRLSRAVSPSAPTPVSAISVFLGIVGVLLFITVDGHHWFVQSLAISYREAPLGSAAWSAATVQVITSGFSNLTLYAVRVAAPLVGIMFLVSVVIALLAKCVPQMNILMIGYPVKIFVGVFAMILALPFVLPVVRDAFGDLHRQLLQLTRMW